MAIKDGFIKTKKRRKLTDGDYKTVSQWTSASTVEMANGNNLQTIFDGKYFLGDSTIPGKMTYDSASGGINIEEYETNSLNDTIEQMILNDNKTVDFINDRVIDTKDLSTTFTSGDSTTSLSSTPPALITSGETHKSLFNKISTAVKNVRWLLSKMGTTDLSGIGDGTVTNAISTLNSNIENKKYKIKTYNLSCKCDNSSSFTVDLSDFGDVAAFIFCGYHNNITTGGFQHVRTNNNGSTFFPIYNNNTLIYLLQYNISNNILTVKSAYSGNTSLYTYLTSIIALY